MNTKKLKIALDELGINKEFYSIQSHIRNDVYVIEEINKLWYVYYNERGNKNSLKFFDKEDDACEYFLKYITSDTVVMMHRNN